ncbi:hypothetical protein KED41_003137 [Escherichia coli]|nr:hypothetical protein [Escherichia coli]
MKNKHTLTRITKTAFEELNRIKNITGLPHSAVMKLRMEKAPSQMPLMSKLQRCLIMLVQVVL